MPVDHSGRMRALALKGSSMAPAGNEAAPRPRPGRKRCCPVHQRSAASNYSSISARHTSNSVDQPVGQGACGVFSIPVDARKRRSNGDQARPPINSIKPTKVPAMDQGVRGCGLGGSGWRGWWRAGRRGSAACSCRHCSKPGQPGASRPGRAGRRASWGVQPGCLASDRRLSICSGGWLRARGCRPQNHGGGAVDAVLGLPNSTLRPCSSVAVGGFRLSPSSLQWALLFCPVWRTRWLWICRQSPCPGWDTGTHAPSRCRSWPGRARTFAVAAVGVFKHASLRFPLPLTTDVFER